MATREIQLVTLIGVLTHFLVGCTVTTNLTEGGNSIPDGWSVEVAHTPEECVSIDGVYEIFGVGKFKGEGDLAQARLDATLGYAFPTVEMPKQVSIAINEETNLIHFNFRGPVNQSFSEPVKCSNGWYKTEKRMTDHYVGDGTTLDYSDRKIELGKSSDGDLVIHVLSETQFSSFLVLKSRESRESWSKYGELRSES